MTAEQCRTRRTNVNFDEHVLTETKTEVGIIYDFKRPDRYCQSIKFINVCGILAVTGDYGNWIFCREFHPSPDGYVSSSYWVEKIKIASTQKPLKFNPERTEEEINEMLSEEDIDDEDKMYLESLLSYLHDGEERYLVYAHDHLPSHRDHEFVPYVETLDEWLEVIFDAFDEICRRMESK